MVSALDNFILKGTSRDAGIIGEDTITLSGVALTGVWSGLSGDVEGEFGGFQQKVNAVVVVKSKPAITLALIGKIGVVKGFSLKCANMDIGEVLTTIYFEHSTANTRLTL